MQVNAERLTHSMHAYICWLGRQLNGLKVALPRMRDTLRNTFRRDGLHLRQPEALANLYLAIDLFLRFAVDHRAVSSVQADEIRDTSVAALKTLAIRQAQSLGTLDTADAFASTLAMLLTKHHVRPR